MQPAQPAVPSARAPPSALRAELRGPAPKSPEKSTWSVWSATAIPVAMAASRGRHVLRRARGAFKGAPRGPGVEVTDLRNEGGFAAVGEDDDRERELREPSPGPFEDDDFADDLAEDLADHVEGLDGPQDTVQTLKEDEILLDRQVHQRLPRLRRSFKKARLSWTDDGRRVYFNEEGEEIDPFKGMNKASSARADGTPKVPPKELQVEVAPEGVNPEETIFGSEKQSFRDLGITKSVLCEALDSLGFQHATKIQGASIPCVLSDDRRAVVISSETGSGKTLAYLVPAFELILHAAPRMEDDRHPNVLILVPSLELGVQVTLVAQQIAQAIFSLERRQIRVSNSRRSWPKEVPDILVCSPRAAAQGLAPCQSEDEMARKQALKRIKDVELVVFDEADLLLDYGSQSNDVQTVLTAIAASFPDQPRMVQPQAQVYRPDGIPVEVLHRSMKWVSGIAWHNQDGTFKVRFEDGRQADHVRRRQLRGPGIGLLVEYGPRFVASCATLPSYARGRCIANATADMQDHRYYNSGIGSVEWVFKRWYPNAVHIKSPWLHMRHPGIQREAWIYIPGESRAKGQEKGTGKRDLQLRIQKTIEILEDQGPDIRTIIFANTAEACLSFEMAAKAAKIKVANVHAGVSFSERIDGLKKFGLGEVPVLICTDLGARGLDLPICQHVIQLEFAGNTVCYLHRVGRATRAANKSQVTNLWGNGDIPIKDLIMKAPAMGLEGDVVSKRGNRCRHRRIRRRQRRNEFIFSKTREKAREARKRTQTRGTEWIASDETLQKAVQ